MTPDTLLTELQTRGIKVRRDGDRLLVTDPARSLTPGLSAAIKKHKAALIERLPATPLGQLPLGVMDDRPTIGVDSKPAQSAAAPSSPAGSDQLVSEPTPAEAALIALLDQWESADNPRDPEWARRYAAAAIAAGAQCFETVTLENESIVQVDAGPHGWARWLAQAEAIA